MLKVLVITYYWPPAGGPGVQRVMKFVKYLPEFDVQPSVLTLEQGDYPAADETLIHEIPESVAVYRVRGWEPYKLYKWFTVQKETETIPLGILSGDLAQSWRTRIANWIRLNLFIPDARRFIVRPFVKKATEVINNNKIDVVLVSSPPHSMQLVGLQLKRKIGIPWVGDFRDPWTGIDYYQKAGRTHFALRRDCALEKKVADSLDSLVAVSQRIIHQFQASHEPKKTTVIYNGFDPEDFAHIPRNWEPTVGDFTIAYYGNLGLDRVIPEFVEAVKLCIQRKPPQVKKFRVTFIGNIHERMRRLFGSASLGDIVDFVNYMPHGELLNEVVSSSMLLLIINRVPDNTGILTGKLFEYLALGKPILGLGPAEGEAAKILEETGSGKMVAYEDIDSMEEFILECMRSRKRVESTLADNILQYSRRNLTRQLAKVLQDV